MELCLFDNLLPFLLFKIKHKKKMYFWLECKMNYSLFNKFLFESSNIMHGSSIKIGDKVNLVGSL